MKSIWADGFARRRDLRTWIGPVMGLILTGAFAAGCGDGDDRPPPTQAATKAADTKRQAYIDSLNISPEQKAIMKSHMGGPPAPSPADAAKGAASAPAGKRTQ